LSQSLEMPYLPVAGTYKHNKMKANATLLALSLTASVSASAAMQCGPLARGVTVVHETVGAISLKEFEQINFDSPASLARALSDKTAVRVPANALACQVTGDGSFDYAAHLKIPGAPFDYWVPESAVVHGD
jgi:hypothetical protein